ncbi:hypothetical protein C2S51_037787 [Perilla frutescens var. frutescens]|nr:hypothetical protein C2S51_037787 [Perilla frutescens var. frutescens]
MQGKEEDDPELQFKGPITRLRAKKLQAYLQASIRRKFELHEDEPPPSPPQPPPSAAITTDFQPPSSCNKCPSSCLHILRFEALLMGYVYLASDHESEFVSSTEIMLKRGAKLLSNIRCAAVTKPTTLLQHFRHSKLIIAHMAEMQSLEQFKHFNTYQHFISTEIIKVMEFEAGQRIMTVGVRLFVGQIGNLVKLK